jgi:hypothetical protein
VTRFGGLEALYAAASALEPERTVSTLAHAFEALSLPDSRWRARLACEHGAFSPEVVELGTAAGLREWDAKRLARLRERELPERFRAPALTVVWLAGSIPTASFSAIALPLLAGSPVYAKCAAGDRVSAPLFRELCQEIDPALARALSVSDGRQRALDLEALRAAEAIVAYGSDATVEALAREASTHQRFLAHGHRLSVAALGPEIPVEQAAPRAAFDLALWDGRGCLSPAFLLVIDRPRGRAAAFAEALFAELSRLARKLPRGRLAAGEEAALRDWRARSAMREGARAWLSEPGTDFGVVVDAQAQATGALRNAPVVPLGSLEELGERCTALHPHLSTIGHAGFADGEPALEALALRAGASRLCPLGRMQLPPIDWSHDGLGALRPLVRALDVERP